MHDIKDSKESYLESILRLSRTQDQVRSVDLSKDLKVSTPSVCTAVQKLIAEGCIHMNSKGHIFLSPEGESIAVKVLMKHKTLEYFFLKIGVDPIIADEDACRMEHTISDACFDVFKDYVIKTFPLEETL